MIALVSMGQLKPGKMDELIGIVDQFMTLFDTIRGYKRYDFMVNREENKTLAVSLLESQADLDALTAALAPNETYAYVGTLYVPGTIKRGAWDVAIQKTPERGPGKIALVSFAQVQPGTMDELLGKIDKMPLFETSTEFRRYDFCVDRAENRTLAVTLLGSQADLDALRASPALAEAYGQTRPLMVPESGEQGVWEVAIQRGPK